MPTRHGPAFYLIVSFFALSSALCRADDWLYCDLTINNAPVHFVFDSAAESSVLFRPTAERLGIKIKATSAEPVANGARADRTEPLVLVFDDDVPVKISMAVVDNPPHMPQGIDGWITLDLLHPREGNFLLLDMNKHAVSSIPTPIDIERWSKWKMVPDTLVPMFECGDGEKIGIAAGLANGVLLSPKKWEKWRAEHKNQPFTLDGYYLQDGSFHMSEEFRVQKIAFGDFTLTDVPVRAFDAPGIASSFKGFDAIIGSYALYQMKVAIDRQHNALYTRLRDDDFPASDYNRLGAVFFPNDPVKSTDLTAHVVTGSPAYQAGIRDNDVLEKIDDLDVTKSKIDSTVQHVNYLWIKPAGTNFHLFLRRDNHPYDVQVTLKELTSVD